MDRLKTIIFVGRSGCGKGTQVKMLREYFANIGTETLLAETGQTLRNLTTSDKVVAKKVKETIDTGHLVPDSIAIWVFVDFLIQNLKDHDTTLIIDGVQRSIVQLDHFQSTMGFLGREKYTVLYIDVSEEWSKERLKSRGRTDDAPERIQNRLDFYTTSIEPMLQMMKSDSRYDVIKINGEQTIPEVHAEIMSKLGFVN